MNLFEYIISIKDEDDLGSQTLTKYLVSFERKTKTEYKNDVKNAYNNCRKRNKNRLFEITEGRPLDITGFDVLNELTNHFGYKEISITGKVEVTEKDYETDDGEYYFSVCDIKMR
jgi:hypothetical protein